MLFLSFAALISLATSVAAFSAVAGSLGERHTLREHHRIQVHGRRIVNFPVNSYQGKDFLNDTCCGSTLLMPFIPYTDPTSGQVKYFSRVNAQQNGPAPVQHDGKAVLRADSWTNHSLGAPRNLNQFTSHTGANPKCSIPNLAPILGGHPAFMTTVLRRASEIADHVVWHPANFIRSYTLSAGGIIYPTLFQYCDPRSAWLRLQESPFASRLWKF